MFPFLPSQKFFRFLDNEDLECPFETLQNCVTSEGFFYKEEGLTGRKYQKINNHASPFLFVGQRNFLVVSEMKFNRINKLENAKTNWEWVSQFVGFPFEVVATDVFNIIMKCEVMHFI